MLADCKVCGEIGEHTIDWLEHWVCPACGALDECTELMEVGITLRKCKDCPPRYRQQAKLGRAKLGSIANLGLRLSPMLAIPGLLPLNLGSRLLIALIGPDLLLRASRSLLSSLTAIITKFIIRVKYYFLAGKKRVIISTNVSISLPLSKD